MWKFVIDFEYILVFRQRGNRRPEQRCPREPHIRCILWGIGTKKEIPDLTETL